ncbi:MAG: EF-hand domain-containing protein [Planctomycetales bacterium]|nr:EF-hand domain-containing protein [Planctomycetales bacterium]
MKSLLGILGAAAVWAAGSLAFGEDARLPGLPAGVDQAVIKQKLLEKFDANGDGTLTGQELQNAQAVLQKQFGAGLGAAGVNFDEFKKRFDKDGDGKLSQQEQAAAMAAFQKARADGVGAAAGAASGGNFGGIPAGGGFGDGPAVEGKARGREAMIKRFDKNGDGKLSDEEKAEAQKALKGKKGEARPAKLTEAMKKFDADGDGKLSDEEKAVAKKELAEKRKGKRPE